MNEKMGTLYGIGVGPGDPDLITMKAVNILKTVHVVFTASSSKNDHSMAVHIAKSHIPEGTPLVRLSFPMCRDRKLLEKAWEDNAQFVIKDLKEGKDVAFLTVGDCMTYSTFGYLGRTVKKLAPSAPIVAVPGITSYQAAAARTNRPLVEGEEAMLLLSGAKGGDRFRQLGQCAENVVFLKAYKNVPDINSALEECGRLENSVGVVACGLPQEKIVEDLREFETSKPEYWTLILSKQKNCREE
jgi:precorrin-2/cobalt-factor-2 C20-methyltransferase